MGVTRSDDVELITKMGLQMWAEAWPAKATETAAKKSALETMVGFC